MYTWEPLLVEMCVCEYATWTTLRVYILVSLYLGPNLPPIQ